MYSDNKKKLFLFNSASGVVQLVLTTILVFVSIPLFRNNLGEELYGAFAAISAIGSMSSFANLSFDTTLIKYISEQGKTKESDHDILVTLLLLFCLLIPMNLLIYVFKDFILISILKIPAEFLASSSVLLNYLLLGNSLLILGKVFTALLNANHKIYLINFYIFIHSTLYWGGIIFVILLGYGLEQIGLSVLAAALIWFAMVAYSALKGWGAFNTQHLFDNFWQTAKKQISYSYKVYTGSLLGFLFEPLTKILISNLMGVSYVGIYEIMLKVKGNIQAIFSKLLFPLQPIIAHEQNKDKLRFHIKNISLFLFYVIIPIIVILYFCADSIILLWIGEEDAHLISLSVKILTSLALLLSTTVVPIYLFLRLKNHPEKEIYIQAANAITNSLVIFFTYRQIGYYSVVWGYALSLIITFAMCIYYQKKYLSFYPFSTLKKLMAYGLYFIGLGLITGLFTLIIRPDSWINIIFVSVFCCFACVLLLYLAGFINKETIKSFITPVNTKK